MKSFLTLLKISSASLILFFSFGITTSVANALTVSLSNPSGSILSEQVDFPVTGQANGGQPFYNMSIDFGDGSGLVLGMGRSVNTMPVTHAYKNFGTNQKTFTITFTATDNVNSDASLRPNTGPSVSTSIQVIVYPAQPTTYPVKVSGGTITNPKAGYVKGDIITVDANVPAGQKFTGWTYEGISLSPDEVKSGRINFNMPAGAVTLTANYVQAPPTKYLLTVISGDGGGSYEEDQYVTITANARTDGQVFKLWTWTEGEGIVLDPDLQKTSFRMPAGPATVTATYDNPVTPPTPPGPTITSATPSLVKQGDTISVSGSGFIATSHVFVTSATGVITTLLTTFKGVAKLEAVIPVGMVVGSYQVSVENPGGNSSRSVSISVEAMTLPGSTFNLTVVNGTASPAGPYAPNSMVTITAIRPATARPDDIFTGWTGATVTGDSKSTTVTIKVSSDNMIVTATFGPKPVDLGGGGGATPAITCTVRTHPDPTAPGGCAPDDLTTLNGGLVPCGQVDRNNDNMIKDYGTVIEECHFDDFLILIGKVTNFLMILGTAVSALAFGWAGILMMTAGGEMAKITHAKSIFTKVVIGFFIMLAAWLIVYALESAFVKPESNIKSFLKRTS